MTDNKKPGDPVEEEGREDLEYQHQQDAQSHRQGSGVFRQRVPQAARRGKYRHFREAGTVRVKKGE